MAQSSKHTPKPFMALKKLFHTPTQTYVKPGEIVDLGHLEDDRIAFIIQKHEAVRPLTTDERREWEASLKPDGGNAEVKPTAAPKKTED